MATVYVLVVTAWVNSFNGGGPMTSFQEFDDIATCQTVGENIQK